MAEAVASPVSTTEVTEKSLSVGFTVYGLVGYLGALVLGAVFLLAAWAKAIHPTAFVEEIANRGLTLGVGAGIVAFLALALEAGLGTLLVLGVRRLWVLVPAALLVGFFLFLTGQDYYRHLAGVEVEGAACGCFGNLVQRTPAEAFWQDLLLLVPALALAFVGRPRVDRDGGQAGGRAGVRAVPPVRTALGALAAAGVVLLAWKAPELPLDDWATRLRPGTQVAALCAGEDSERMCLDMLVPGLDEGEHLVVLTELDEAFGERVDRINRYLDASYLGAARDAPPVEVVTTAGPEERQRFFWQWGPGFDAVQAPETLMAPLYRRLPRSFLVRDGEVVETWDDLPPFERWAPNIDDQLASTGEMR